MGRTVPTMTLMVQSDEENWAPFRRALRAQDRVAFDRLFAAARHYAARIPGVQLGRVVQWQGPDRVQGGAGSELGAR